MSDSDIDKTLPGLPDIGGGRQAARNDHTGIENDARSLFGRTGNGGGGSFAVAVDPPRRYNYRVTFYLRRSIVDRQWIPDVVTAEDAIVFATHPSEYTYVEALRFELHEGPDW